MYKIRVEFEVEPGNVSIDPQAVSVFIMNGDKWEVFENVTDLTLDIGRNNEFVMRKLPESQVIHIPLNKDQNGQ